MAQQTINYTAPTADLLAAGAAKVNANFTEVYAADQNLLGNIVFDNAPASTTYRYLATLPTSSSATYERLLIEFVGGIDWGNNALVRDWVVMTNRNGFRAQYMRLGADTGSIRTSFLKVVAYTKADASVDVYLVTPGGSFAFNQAPVRILGFGTTGAVGAIAPGATTTTTPTNTGTAFDSSTATANAGIEAGAIFSGGTQLGTANYTPFAYPIGGGHDKTLTSQSLAAAGGAIAVPILLSSAIKLQSISFWNTDTTLARGPIEFAIYQDQLNNANALPLVTNAVGTLASYTAASAQARPVSVTTPPVTIPAGVYWIVLKNNHATNTLGVGCVAQSATWAGTSNSQTKTLGTGALGSTLDFVLATWAKQVYVPNIRLNARAFGQSSAF